MLVTSFVEKKKVISATQVFTINLSRSQGFIYLQYSFINIFKKNPVILDDLFWQTHHL